MRKHGAETRERRPRTAWVVQWRGFPVRFAGLACRRCYCLVDMTEATRFWDVMAAVRAAVQEHHMSVADFNVVPAEACPVRTGDATVREVMGQVARVWGVRVPELMARNRAQRVVDPRHAAFWILRHDHGMALGRIAAACGRSAHGTVMAGVRHAEELMATDPAFRAALCQARGSFLIWRFGKFSRGGFQHNNTHN